MVNYAQYIPTSLLTTAGDMLIENATPAAARLPAGTAGQMLGLSGSPLLPAWQAAFSLQAATALAGYTLVNGTGDVLTWTTPNDGAMHRVMFLASMNITSPETGGQITIRYVLADNTALTHTLFAAGQGAGEGSQANFYMLPVAPNALIKVSQATALTAGAAKLWAEIWGS